MSEVNINQAAGRNIPLSNEVKRYTFKGAAGYYVYSKDYDAAQSELAALREELAADCVAHDAETDLLRQKLTAAEQRNSELVDLLKMHSDHVADLADSLFRVGACMGPTGKDFERKIYAALAQQQVVLAALKPTESGASE